MKIGQYLTKLEAKYSGTFSGHAWSISQSGGNGGKVSDAYDCFVYKFSLKLSKRKYDLSVKESAHDIRLVRCGAGERLISVIFI